MSYSSSWTMRNTSRPLFDGALDLQWMETNPIFRIVLQLFQVLSYSIVYSILSNRPLIVLCSTTRRMWVRAAKCNFRLSISALSTFTVKFPERTLKRTTNVHSENHYWLAIYLKARLTMKLKRPDRDSEASVNPFRFVNPSQRSVYFRAIIDEHGLANDNRHKLRDYKLFTMQLQTAIYRMVPLRIGYTFLRQCTHYDCKLNFG